MVADVVVEHVLHSPGQGECSDGEEGTDRHDRHRQPPASGTDQHQHDEQRGTDEEALGRDGRTGEQRDGDESGPGGRASVGQCRGHGGGPEHARESVARHRARGPEQDAAGRGQSGGQQGAAPVEYLNPDRVHREGDPDPRDDRGQARRIQVFEADEIRGSEQGQEQWALRGEDVTEGSETLAHGHDREPVAAVVVAELGRREHGRYPHRQRTQPEHDGVRPPSPDRPCCRGSLLHGSRDRRDHRLAGWGMVPSLSREQVARNGTAPQGCGGRGAPAHPGCAEQTGHAVRVIRR